MLFLNLFIFRSKKRQSKFLRCARAFYLVFEARLLQFPASAGRFSFLHVAIKRLKQKGDYAMTTTNTKRIAELNDLCRKAPGIAGKMFVTQGITALPDDDRSAICEKVETFDSFTEDNDPHGEHDFGAFEHGGHKIFWKIDYYDWVSFGTGRDMGSEDPSGPAQTLRVLTIMVASEY